MIVRFCGYFESTGKSPVLHNGWTLMRPRSYTQHNYTVGFEYLRPTLTLNPKPEILSQALTSHMLPIGSSVAPFCSLYLGTDKIVPERNYYGAYG